MNTISNDVWKRKGSSVVFDQKSLAPLIIGGALVSLREFLGWGTVLPANPPVPDRTILISGLETVLETMDPVDADYFLTQRIRPLLMNIQNKWTDAGFVFGFSSHQRAFEETSFNEELLFRRRDQKTIRLSEGLWNGSAPLYMKRVVHSPDTAQQQDSIVGYYVDRIS